LPKTFHFYHAQHKAKNSALLKGDVIMQIVKWLRDRALEPSTWAAVAVACIGVAFIFNNFWIAIAGLVVAGGGFLLREKF
jgi:hypothetical protein|tara:strand:- start:3432 stop:3671 length:240 start_codon:yes stop_codon:yes gene_type:complete